MGHDLLERYIWLVDTIRRHGRLSRSALDRLWKASRFSEGEPLPRRTFYNYRQAIAELFNIEIKCDQSTYEYYLSDYGDSHNETVTDWLLDSAATHDLLASNRSVASKIFLENIPSAREHLASVVEALDRNVPLTFDYHAFGRVLKSAGVVVEPYFLKLFRQRWYVTGRHTASNKVKTYALDRIANLTIGTEPFTPDPDFSPEDYFRNSFGIIFTKGEVKHIAIRADLKQAQYFRALPLHHTQQESVHDTFSIFHYNLRISDDLVNELLSYGSRIQVLEPRELVTRMCNELNATLNLYSEGAEEG